MTISGILKNLKTVLMPKTSVFDCSIINLPRIHDRAGNITVVENSIHIPFAPKRVFYLYDIPGGESRGAHAHRECHQFLVAASLDDGKAQRQILLNRPYIGLHIPPMIWASELNFSSGSVCLVLASHTYDGKDYIRNYNSYLEVAGL
jgi:hypothetical protein